MNKYILYFIIGFLFLSTTSADTNNCIDDLYLQIDKNQSKNYKKDITQNEFGIRHLIDSINYQIIRRWKEDKTPIIESISNKLTNIDYWKEYHENGQLKAVGFMTSSVNTHIGKWKYYSASGKLDSIVDFDNRYKLPFCKFYQIAKEKGLTGKTSTIDFNIDTRKWRIEKWTYGKNHSTATGIELQVDSMKINEIKLLGIY